MNDNYWDAESAAQEMDRLNIELASKQKEIDALQSKLDALMLEYCPEYMEDAQLLEWERNQRTVKENQK